MQVIPFNKVSITDIERDHVQKALNSENLSSDSCYNLKCQTWFDEYLKAPKTFLVPSGTAGLELAALLMNISAGDEIIMPSYTFVSTANAFTLRGAKIVFVDVRPDTMNIDETKISSAITDRTKAIVVVHYAGVACEMDEIMEIAQSNSLYVVEDAAQAFGACYKQKKLGTIGHFGVFSFHETKNYTSGGEGGLLIVNEKEYVLRAEILREKGTNRSQFFRGQIDKYTWQDTGSSYLLSELQAAFLYGQLQRFEEIRLKRRQHWQYYLSQFTRYDNGIPVPVIPTECDHNAHIFYLKLETVKHRSEFIQYLKNEGIQATFHYIPLHSSPAAVNISRFDGADIHTTSESERLVRLPLYYDLNQNLQDYIISKVRKFFS